MILKMKKYILLLVMCVVFLDVSAQSTVILPGEDGIAHFKASVSSVSEFKVLFNAQMDNPVVRQSNLKGLYLPNKNVPEERIDKFILEATTAIPFLTNNYELRTDGMLSKIKFEATYNGQSQLIDLWLEKRTKSKVVWWELIDFSSPILDSLFLRDSASFIPPHAEEVKFSVLTTDRPNIKPRYASYLPENFETDPLSVMITLINLGHLKLLYASNIILYITEFPGWVVGIEQKEMGWVITELYETSTDQKEYILKLKN